VIVLTASYWLWVIACVFALVQTVLLGLHSWEHRRFARRRIRDARPVDQSWRVALLSPCKGMDLDLEQNLQHLLLQDYSNYEVLFIVETLDDPAFPVIERLASQSHVPVRIVVSGRAELTGQKIHNLLVATEQVSPDVKILAFVDSDTCPSSDWLGKMIARLYRPTTGAVTGYRWFVPARTTLGNCLLSSINSSIAALLGAGNQHIVWGGSWAIRRDDFDAIGIRDAWKNTLSDDLVATKSLHQAGLRIDYEPACMTASPMDYPVYGMFSFLRRQHLIGRIYAPRLWYQSLATLLVSSIAIVGAIGLASYDLLMGRTNDWITPVAILVVWYGIQIYRGLVRRDLARLYVSPADLSVAMKRAIWFDVFCAPLALIVNTIVMCGACWGARIVWRGITYDLDREGRILNVTRESHQKGPASQGPVSRTPQERRLRFDPPQPFHGVNEPYTSFVE